MINRHEYMPDLRMYNREETAELLGTHVDTISTLNEIGILKGIKIGKNYMFSYDAIKQFQIEYMGTDLSNKMKALEVYRGINGLNK
jgi:hypothetical protein